MSNGEIHPEKEPKPDKGWISLTTAVKIAGQGAYKLDNVQIGGITRVLSEDVAKLMADRSAKRVERQQAKLPTKIVGMQQIDNELSRLIKEDPFEIK
jgi:hypothetical protein